MLTLIDRGDMPWGRRNDCPPCSGRVLFRVDMPDGRLTAIATGVSADEVERWLHDVDPLRRARRHSERYGHCRRAADRQLVCRWERTG